MLPPVLRPLRVFSLLDVDASGRISRHEDHWSVADPIEGSCLSGAYWLWRRTLGWVSTAVVRSVSAWSAPAPALSHQDPERPRSDLHEQERLTGMTSAQVRKSRRRRRAATEETAQDDET